MPEFPVPSQGIVLRRPTEGKPTGTLRAPSDPGRASSFLNIRVTDIHAVHQRWTIGGTAHPSSTP
jgi:hypothetical protein